MGKPFVYAPGAQFPAGKRPRVIKLNAIVSNQNINAGAFRVDEGAWVYGRTAELMGDPSRWVGVAIDLLNFRAAALKVKGTTNTQRGFLGKITVTHSYPYNAQFLAAYQVLHTVFFRCIEPANRARFAWELRAKPYECEILKGNAYTSSVIAGVLAENPALRGMQPLAGQLPLWCSSSVPIAGGATSTRPFRAPGAVLRGKTRARPQSVGKPPT